LIRLAKLDSVISTQLLDAARAIQSETNRASVLSSLTELDSTDFAQLLDAARAIQDETNRASVLIGLAKTLPNIFLPQVFDIVDAIIHTLLRARVFNAYFPCLPVLNLPIANWRSYLHLLAHRTRAELMQDLAALYPAIVHLGGKEAVRGMVDAMRDVCNQWK
jgi:hypothetical protein